jgi:hypothetical protein
MLPLLVMMMMFCRYCLGNWLQRPKLPILPPVDNDDDDVGGGGGGGGGSGENDDDMVHSPSCEEPKSSTTVATLSPLFHHARSYQEHAGSSPDKRQKLQVAGQSNGRRNAPSHKLRERPTSTGSQTLFPCTFFCHKTQVARDK